MGQQPEHALHCDSLENLGHDVYIRTDLSNLRNTGDKYRYLVTSEMYGRHFKHSRSRTPDRDMKTQWYPAISLIHKLAHAYYARITLTLKMHLRSPGATPSLPRLTRKQSSVTS